MAWFVPEEVRRGAVEAYLAEEGTLAEVAERFGVSAPSLSRWLAAARRGESLEPKPRAGGRRALLDDSDLAFLKSELGRDPDLKAADLQQLLAKKRGKTVSIGTVNRALHKAGLESALKPTLRGDEVSREEKPPYRYEESHRKSPPSRARRGYPSDLTDEQWEILEPLFRGKSRRGRPRKYPLREILNGVLFIVRTGCQWRYLPNDLPPWEIVAKTYYRWVDTGKWEEVNASLRRKVRVNAGRPEEPSAGLLDSQSVKTSEKGGSADMTGRRRSRGGSGIS